MTMDLDKIKQELREYDGKPLRLMEVCGTHTAEISRNGIRSLLSPKIKLVSGPGCPVCVTVSSYLDRLVELSLTPGITVVTFGDLLRVPGSEQCLNDARAMGGSVKMVYSPLDVIPLAQKETRIFVFAAVGFETTAPVYAALLQQAEALGLTNIRLLTSLKTMPAVIDWVCSHQSGIDGFLAPGHVSVITGSEIFTPLAQKYQIPFAIAGFQGGELLSAVYALIKLQGQGRAVNLYPSAVTAQGNLTAQSVVKRYFIPHSASWRGMGIIPDSGMILRPEYACYDMGSAGLIKDLSYHSGCQCAQVLTGEILPTACPLFGKICTPQTPQGACMVSGEGSCFHYFLDQGA